MAIKQFVATEGSVVTKFDNYLRALRRLEQNPQDSTRVPAEEMPPRQLTVALDALMYRRRQQLWVQEFRVKELDPFICQFLGRPLAKGEHLGRTPFPERSGWIVQAGVGHTWMDNEYTGEFQCVETGDPCARHLAEDLDFEFKVRRNPSWVYWRMREQYPSVDGIWAAFDCLHRYGIVEGCTDGAFGVNGDILQFQSSFDAYFDNWLCFPERRVGIAVMQGDWDYVHQNNPTPESEARAKASREEWLGHLDEEFSDKVTPFVIKALADVGALEPYLPQAFANPDAAGWAAECARNVPQFCDEVFALFEKALNSEPRGAHLVKFAEFLVRHDFKAVEILTTLGEKHVAYDLLLQLAVCHAPEALPKLVRHGREFDDSGDRHIAEEMERYLNRQVNVEERIERLREAIAEGPQNYMGIYILPLIGQCEGSL